MAIRATVKYTGNVQGVGFRATCHNIAGRYQVTGYVRNEPDGSVTLVAEGNESEVDAFLDAVDNAMSDYINDKRVVKDPAEREFDAFDIRFA
jgi:acylphosphatase